MIEYRADGENGEIPAREFYIGPMITTLPAGAVLSGVRFPVWRGKVGIGFHEVNARRSDFAFVSAAAQVELGDDGKCKRIAIGIGAATDFPLRLDSAEQQLTGSDARRHRGAHGAARSARRYRHAGRSARLRRLSPPRRGRSGGARGRRCAQARRKENRMRIELDINGSKREVEVEPRTTLLDCLRDTLGLTGAHAGCEHGVCGACTVLFDGVAVRSCLMFAVQAQGSAITTIEGVTPRPGRAVAGAGRLLRDARHAMRLLHAGHDPDRACAARRQSEADARGDRRGDLRQYLPLHRLCADRRGDRARRRAHARRQPAEGRDAHERARPHRYVSTDRRVREDRRFVVGKGRFVADIGLPNTKHVALVTCPYPAARIKSIDKSAALAMPGVHYVLDGAELAAATLPLMTGLDTPNVPRRPLAFEVARYAGEWVAAVVADTRALAEDAAEKVKVVYEKLPFVLDAEQALGQGQPAGAPGARLQRAARQDLRLGRGRQGFRRQPAQAVAAGEMGPLVDGADRDLRRRRELGPLARHARRLGLDPDAAIRRPDRHGAETSGVVGARALRRRRRRQLRRQARHQAHGAGRLSLAPARLPGAADRGPAGKHARRRRARAGAAVRRRGRLRRPGHHPLDEDARAGQCRRLCRPLAVPARQADRRHRRALQDQERAVPRHGRGHQQDHAGGGARLRPVADQCGDRAHHRRGRATCSASTRSRCAGAT